MIELKRICGMKKLGGRLLLFEVRALGDSGFDIIIDGGTGLDFRLFLNVVFHFGKQ